FMYDVEGKIININPTDINSNVVTKIPMNLGYVIKSTEILEFKKVFNDLLKIPTSQSHHLQTK
ncbi:hypothetical protein, partial [Flavobacterium sp.]|uniref:hypothetical protein n=1 Tax=Flavobacterium sp. TaxID=239 RepID=UPI00374CF37D